VITDLNAATLQTYEAEPASTNPDAVTERLIELTRQALADAGPERVVGVGIAVPGIADSRQGLIEYYPDINLRNYPLGAIVKDKTGIFPVIYNRVNAAAIGESRQGAGRAARSLYYISVGDGIGGGMVLRGQLYQGASTVGSEIGHVTVAPNGDLCYCGNRGCLFTVASGPALAGRFREQIKHGQTSRLVAEVDGRLDLIDGLMVLQAAYKGDDVAMHIVSTAADYLGIALANVINLLSPEVIVLGGPLIDDCPEPWVDLIRKSLHRHALSGPMRTAQIVVGHLGMLSRSVGAAALAITAWLKSEAPAHFLDLAELPARQLQPPNA
jgi:predicted NBD/HSP70 family sugar kinase